MTRLRLSRRQLAGAVVGCLAAPAAGQDVGKQSPTAAAVNALLEIVKVRHGKQLPEAALKQVREGLAEGLAMADRVKAVKLAPADEPAFVFQADLP